MTYASRAERLSLTQAQRAVLDSDDIAWEGWDAANLPVVSVADDAQMWVGVPAGRYAVDRNGAPRKVTEPVTDRGI